MSVQMLTDPADFVEAALGFLDADPVPNNVIASQAQRVCDEIADGSWPAEDAHAHLWFVVRDRHGEVMSAAMRTPGMPAYVLGMPAAAAAEVARKLYAIAPDLPGVNGDIDAARAFALEWTRLGAVTVVERRASRLFRLAELRPPLGVPGRLRPAAADDLDLLYGWTVAFGREAGGAAEPTPRDRVARKVDLGHAWLWLADPADGSNVAPVSYTGAAVPVRGVHRIGPVYTPSEHRGHGYASSCVAQVSALLRDASGAGDPQVCLFTDLANPTSNKIYQAIGYEPVCDTVNLGFQRP